MASIVTYPPGDTLDGTSENDVIETLYNNFLPHRYIYGFEGNDLITVNSWHFSRYHPIYWFEDEQGDKIDGGAGNDTIYGNDGGNNIYGGIGHDKISGGTPEFDPIFGQDDVDDIVYAGVGRDTLEGEGGHDIIYGDNGADHMSGGAENDSLYGGRGYDTIIGDEGSDSIFGGAGKDMLTGGSGADRFIFLAVSESGRTASTRDVITDFEVMLDRIDLRSIDANINSDGDQAFKFIGSNAFTKAAGELKFFNGVILADVNADGRADFKIELTGVSEISASDFVL